MKACPCMSTKNYDECCGPILKDASKAKTAEALMRARYTAFTEHNVDYVVNTHHTSTREELDRASVESWAKNSEWLGLEIVSKENGEEKDQEGKVEFKCKFKLEGKVHVHHELSTFKKEGNQWYFVDGSLCQSTIRRHEPKIGRNDPCSCGSGKKFKKCCGQ